MSVIDTINGFLLGEQEARKSRTRSGKWSPSKFGRCYRMQYWHRKNQPESDPPTIETLRKFKAGDLFHSFVQKFLPPHQIEVKVEADDILGFADIVTDDTVIDIKSQHSRAFWYMEKSKVPITEQKYTNILQVMTYARLLNKPNGQLLFVSKDDLVVAEYNFKLEEWADEVDREISALRSIWVKEELPKAEPRAFNGKECEYCQFKTKCKEVEDAGDN